MKSQILHVFSVAVLTAVLLCPVATAQATEQAYFVKCEAGDGTELTGAADAALVARHTDDNGVVDWDAYYKEVEKHHYAISFSEAAAKMCTQAKQGDAEAQYNLAEMFADGKGVAEDKEAAAHWYRKAAEQGHASAQFSLGFAYQYGWGVAINDRDAVIWYRKAAEQGHASAQFSLGNAYDGMGPAYDIVGLSAAFGAHGPEDKEDAVRWYRKAAEQGLATAQCVLGDAYSTGEGIGKDDREAVRWWHKAAEQGITAAQFRLGEAYRYGKGVAKNDHEAVRWYRKVAAGRLEDGKRVLGVRAKDARYILGSVYHEGPVVKQIADVRKWRKAAERGEAWAQYNMGIAYDKGKGVPESDYYEALRWFHKAAEQGHVHAQYNLGRLYRSNGKHRESVGWYRKAAEQGLRGAQVMLSQAYADGKGVTKNARQAVRWFREAAEQGSAWAQYRLGKAYTEGLGVIRDAREAYIWMSLADVNGDELEHLRFSMKSDLRFLRKQLTQNEIRSADKEAARRLDAIDLRIETKKASASGSKGSNTASRVFESAWRSVVVVSVSDGQGSGVIVRPNVVATNCHVVDTRGEIKIYKSDNRRADTSAAFSARIRHSDEDEDFCLLDVDGLWGVPATVRKYDTLGIGEDVYGLGAPQGLDLSLSAGVISQLRKIDGNRLIQTDTAISPGSSGGGLFDSDGNLIGIMTAKIADESTEGIGFAIPADLVLGH